MYYEIIDGKYIEDKYPSFRVKTSDHVFWYKSVRFNPELLHVDTLSKLIPLSAKKKLN